jgi:hypothetical protein
MKEHVQNNHGLLGALYIDRTEANGGFRYLEGGNTSTWIGLVNKGLYDPEQITWGGWGGRFGKESAHPVDRSRDRESVLRSLNAHPALAAGLPERFPGPHGLVRQGA